MRSTTAAGLLVAVAVIGGCSTAPAAPPAAGASASGEQAVTGDLLRYRRDVPARRLQVRLTAADPTWSWTP